MASQVTNRDFGRRYFPKLSRIFQICRVFVSRVGSFGAHCRVDVVEGVDLCLALGLGSGHRPQGHRRAPREAQTPRQPADPREVRAGRVRPHLRDTVHTGPPAGPLTDRKRGNGHSSTNHSQDKCQVTRDRTGILLADLLTIMSRGTFRGHLF